FKMAIHAALKSGYEVRATMRARSAKQRFPVAQWKEDLEVLQSTSIKLFKRRVAKLDRRVGDHSGTTTPRPGWMTPRNGSVTPRSGWQTPRSGWATPNFLRSPANSAPVT
ncbi:Cell wall alpha-1,3-glucan synthase ags1, partial [Cryomyces antarcticus]